MISYPITHNCLWISVDHNEATLAKSDLLSDHFYELGSSGGLRRRQLSRDASLATVIGYDKASKIAHFAIDHELTLKADALQLGFVTEAEFDRVVDPVKMVKPYVATGA